MELKDRLTRGFAAGVAGGIVMNIVNTISYLLNISNLRLLDWPAVIIFGHKPTSALEAGFALLLQIIFVAFLGVIFAYLVSTLLTSTNYLLKGWLYGSLIFFAIYAIIALAKIPELTDISVGNAITNFVDGSVFGLVLAETLRWLDNKTKI